MPVESVPLSDRERDLLRAIADQRGTTVDEVAEQLLREALAKKFRQGLGRAPAKVYDIRRKK